MTTDRLPLIGHLPLLRLPPPSTPRLLLPSVQVNIRAGRFPPADANGVRYLTIPVKLKCGPEAVA